MTSVRAALMLLALAQPAPDPRDRPMAEQFKSFPHRSAMLGVASFYGKHFGGRPMANGQPYEPMALTAASRSLPLGLAVRVVNLRNKRSVEVTITDRGPYLEGRLIDLSLGAARLLRMVGPGLVPVWVIPCDDKRLSTPEEGPSCSTHPCCTSSPHAPTRSAGKGRTRTGKRSRAASSPPGQP